MPRGRMKRPDLPDQSTKPRRQASDNAGSSAAAAAKAAGSRSSFYVTPKPDFDPSVVRAELNEPRIKAAANSPTPTPEAAANSPIGQAVGKLSSAMQSASDRPAAANQQFGSQLRAATGWNH